MTAVHILAGRPSDDRTGPRGALALAVACCGVALAGEVDNHRVLTASSSRGTLYAHALDATCDDWTSLRADGRPMCGISWPRDGGNASWISNVVASSGCGAGVDISGAFRTTVQGVGANGGYGAIYCFALQP